MKSLSQAYTKICQHCNLPQRSVVNYFSSLTQSDHEEKKLSLNENVKPVQTFINRNPRNLERFALANKDIGWGRLGNPIAKNLPARYYYHRLCLQRTSGHTYAYLEHYYGNKVVEVSTKDWSIRKHLYKTTDVTACAVLGSILVEMCIRAGISCAEWIPESENQSEATAAFLDAFTGVGFSLEEPDEVLFHKTLNYDKRGPKPEDII